MAVVAPASLGFRAFFFRLPRSPPCLPELSVSPARPLAATRCGANGLCRRSLNIVLIILTNSLRNTVQKSHAYHTSNVLNIDEAAGQPTTISEFNVTTGKGKIICAMKPSCAHQHWL